MYNGLCTAKTLSKNREVVGGETIWGSRSPEKDRGEEDDGPLAGSRDEAGEETQGQKEDCILFIGDLARVITEADLERAFSHAGKVSQDWRVGG